MQTTPPESERTSRRLGDHRATRVGLIVIASRLGLQESTMNKIYIALFALVGAAIGGCQTSEQPVAELQLASGCVYNSVTGIAFSTSQGGARPEPPLFACANAGTLDPAAR